MGRLTVLGVLVAATLASLMAAPARGQSGNLDSGIYAYRVLDNPTGGDAFLFRNAIQQKAQQESNALYSALSGLLGGTAPTLNFVPTGNTLLTDNAPLSANVADSPGGPIGTINVSPLAAEALTNNASNYHDASVVGFPHEMAHLHQTKQTLADVLSREGGAQAFADIVAPTAAQRAHIQFTPGDYDGGYSDYVQQVQPRGRGWILAGQFGNTGTPQFP